MSWKEPCVFYRNHYSGIVEDLYLDCGPWPSSRSKKWDAIIEEILRLQLQLCIAPDPRYCIFEQYNRKTQKMELCGKQCFTHHTESLCAEHLDYYNSFPEYHDVYNGKHIFERRMPAITYARLARSWYATFGHMSNPKLKALRRTL